MRMCLHIYVYICIYIYIYMCMYLYMYINVCVEKIYSAIRRKLAPG